MPLICPRPVVDQRSATLTLLGRSWAPSADKSPILRSGYLVGKAHAGDLGNSTLRWSQRAWLSPQLSRLSRRPRRFVPLTSAPVHACNWQTRHLHDTRLAARPRRCVSRRGVGGEKLGAAPGVPGMPERDGALSAGEIRATHAAAFACQRLRVEVAAILAQTRSRARPVPAPSRSRGPLASGRLQPKPKRKRVAGGGKTMHREGASF